MALIVGRRRMSRLLTVTGLTGVLALAVSTPAIAATTITSSGLSASVAGTSVTVTTTIKSSVATTASSAGICARSSAGTNRDFPFTAPATLTAAGTKFTKTATLAAGAYTYWSCAKVNGRWNNLDTARSFTVGSTASTSGQAMPVGNLPGWKQTFTEDFNTPLALGAFPGAYSAKWSSYDGFADSRNKGDYNQKIISAHNGMLDLYLHQVNGRAQDAAPVPLVTGKFGGQTYGKFTVRFKSDPVPGYGAAWLLWPDSDNWYQGEIDFPEGGLDGTFWGFNHCLLNPASNCDYVDTKASYTSWHTTSVEWTPKGVSFLLDGKLLKTSTSAIPKNPLHWVLQTETNTEALTGASGHLVIDWLTIYSYTG